MTDLSIAIQHNPHHANRRQWVEAMVSQLRLEDPDLRLDIIKDVRGEGCWPTHKRALRAARDALHQLLLQDDLALCRDFVASVKEVICARPNNLIALYANTHAVHRARARRERWVEKPGLCGPAMIWPTAWINEFLDWQDAHIDRGFPWDTVRVSMWLIKTSKRVFATVPSLTEHVGCGSSTIGLNGRSKVASWFLGSSRSGVGIDWTRGLSSPQKDPHNLRSEWWRFLHD